MACVNVCPMGIDIRDGQQLECITCALCIDACDDIMKKLGRERGLVDYIALKDEQNERAGNPKTPILKHMLRPRTLLYTGLWALVGVALTVALFIRPALEVTIRPVRNPTYVTLADGSIRNTYEIGVRNRHGDDRPYYFALSDGTDLKIELEGTDELVVIAEADEEKKVRVYVIAPKGSDMATLDRSDLRIWIKDGVTGDRTFKDTVFNGQGR